MDRYTAIKYLMETDGWNYVGAAEIVDTAIADNIVLTEGKLIELSADYKDR